MIIKEKVKKLPSTPGIYLMKDSQDTIIYVGKAKNLKRRVQSYFQKSKAHPQKIKKMISNINDFDFILTDTEFEAFMLECKWIKEIKPLFNKKMKSSHSYVYIVVHMDEELHYLEIVNNPKKSNEKLYFGPYISRHTVEKAIGSIKENFKILCSNPSNKGTACLNYSLGLCMGICLGGPAIAQHNIIFSNIISLLSGKDLSLLNELKQKMDVAVEQFDFESAAKYRDHINVINFLINKEKIIDFTEENRNIAVIEYLSDSTFKLFLIKRNTILFSEKYFVDHSNIEQITIKILTYFNSASLNPTNKVNRDEIDEAQIIYSYLNRSACNYIVIPEKWLEHGNNTSLNEALSQLLSKQSPYVIH